MQAKGFFLRFPSSPPDSFEQADDDLLVVKSGEEGELCGDDPSSSCKGSGLKNDVEVGGFDLDF